MREFVCPGTKFDPSATFTRNTMKRRSFFRSTAVLTGASMGVASPRAKALVVDKSAADPAYTIRNHHLKQTIMGWCFNPMDTLVLARHCKEIGLAAMEGIDKKHYPEVKKLGLGISLV